MTEPTSYTQIPRATMWLLQEDDFVMGGESPDTNPSFPTYVESFYISKAPITNVQFEAFQPEYIRVEGSSDDSPAVGVTLFEAAGYCEWYARISKKKFRLPTEIEWEFACRGGTTGPHFVDIQTAGNFIWSAENSGSQAQLAESLKANPAGLHNMLGNVWEWTCSQYLPYPLSGADPDITISSEARYVMRGGSFREPLTKIGAGIRRAADAQTKADNVGFRIVRSL